MKANELRIGNYYNQFGNERTVTGETIKDLTNAPNEQLWCKPIPLTEEWLLRFGFEAIDDGWYQKVEFTWNIYDYLVRWNGNVINAQYVHQIQNLYFALTGEELTIN